MCERELEPGILCDVDLAVFVLGAGVLTDELVVATRVPGGRLVVEADNAFGFGVTLWSADGKRDFRCTLLAGVFAAATLGSGTEASDIGGEGGSWIAGAVSLVDNLVSGGVVIRGELAVESGEFSACLSNVGDSSMERSVDMEERCFASCFLILSCSNSASILRSDSSSRSL
jgi:hypothetical protein